MISSYDAAILENQQLASSIWRLQLDVAALAQQVRPGQFVQVRVTNTYDPFLRTPLSVHDCDAKAGTIALLYQTVGTSTHALSRRRPGASVNILGPLGNGFTLPPARSNGNFALLVAGGIGIAPLLFLARELVAKKVSTRLLYGARTAADLAGIDAFEQLGVAVACCTDDGSQGLKGNVVDLLAGYLQSGAAGNVYACGPTPMLRALQQLVRSKGLAAQFSLEAYMACGLGACLGCVVAVPGGGYAHVCTDGPVFKERGVEL